MNRDQNAQARAAILTVLEATGKPMKSAEIANHPAGRKYKARTVGQLLKAMDEVAYNRGTKKWQRVQARHAVAVARHAPSGEPVVAYSRSQRRLVLKVDGAEFPFDIID